MTRIKIISNSYEGTLTFGAQFSKALQAGDIVCLYGDLGAGKTAFVKGMAKGLNLNPLAVHSPTFTLMNIYQGKVPLYHFDLYRIRAEDLFGLGYEEFFYGKGITAVEWSERLEALLPDKFWKVELIHAGDEVRCIHFSFHGKDNEIHLKKLEGFF